MKDIFETYDTSELKKIISVFSKVRIFRGITTMNKEELINLMLKNEDVFKTLKPKSESEVQWKDIKVTKLNEKDLERVKNNKHPEGVEHMKTYGGKTEKQKKQEEAIYNRVANQYSELVKEAREEKDNYAKYQKVEKIVNRWKKQNKLTVNWMKDNRVKLYNVLNRTTEKFDNGEYDNLQSEMKKKERQEEDKMIKQDLEKDKKKKK